MKTINIPLKLDFDNFTKLLSKGYSGGGDNENFTIFTIAGKLLENQIIIPQKVMQLYTLYTQTKCLLEEELKTLKS